MKVGIMQPYFLPYIGYWQLMNAVDRYVIYDDVNFIKGGWINRNRILLNGQIHFLNVPMLGASSNKKINEISINLDRRLMEKNLRMLQAAYGRAPYYEQVYPLMETIFRQEVGNLAKFVTNSIYVIAEYLGIKTEFLVSSEMEKSDTLRGQDRVLDICRRLGATEYYNAIGGRELYAPEAFSANGIKLWFLRANDIIYPQFNDMSQPGLSILDIMMFNTKETIESYLQDFTLSC